MITSTLNKGFQLTFENGLTISVQFGAGNYCANRSLSVEYGAELKQEITSCIDAEIAIWDNSDKMFNFGNGNGLQLERITPDEVAIWIDKVRRAKNLETIERL